MIKSDAFQIHLAGLAKGQQHLRSLYLFSGDEPLLMMEGIDSLRSFAKSQGFTERDVMVQDRYFDWTQLQSVGQSMSLFGDKRFVELKMPTGKPGRDGAEALKELAAGINQSDFGLDAIICIQLPRLDLKTKNSSWFMALDEVGMAVQIDSIERSQLPHWISKRLSQQSQTLASGAAGQRTLEWMANQVEGNLIAAHQEIQKLGLLYPAGELTEDQVRNSVLKVARYDVFELTEALLAGDAARLNRMLEGLQGEGEPLPLILWGISDELRTLYKTQSALAAGENLPNLLRSYRIWGKREKLYPAALKRIQPKKLKQALLLAANLDKQAKGLWVRDLPASPWDGLRLIGSLLR